MHVCVSTGTLPLAVGRSFVDYLSIPQAANLLGLSGLELVFLPEWERLGRPLTPSSVDWGSTPKVECSTIADLLAPSGVPIRSVHLNRDIGNMLCSPDPRLHELAQTVFYENMAAADRVKVPLVVLHLWDTYAAHVDLPALAEQVIGWAADFPGVRLTIENIPLSATKLSPHEAWLVLDQLLPINYGFTLDLKWCSLYGNFATLTEFLPKIRNVHVQGSLIYENSVPRLVPGVGELDMMTALRYLGALGYDGQVTLELNRPRGVEDFHTALRLINTCVEQEP